MCNVQVYTGFFFLGVFQLKNIMISIKVNMHSYHTVYTCIFFFMLCYAIFVIRWVFFKRYEICMLYEIKIRCLMIW